MLKLTTQYAFHDLFLNSPSIHQYYIFTCYKSTNEHRMVTVNYFTCDNSTNVHKMAIVNYFTCDKSVQWVEKSLSHISNSELCAREFLICRILSMSSVSLICPDDG